MRTRPTPVSLDDAMSFIAEDPSRALDALLTVVSAEESPLGDRASASYGAARSALQLGRPIDALDYIAEARRYFVEAEDPVGAARTNLGRINVLDDLGRHREAAAIGVDLASEVTSLLALEPKDETLRWMRAAALENTGASLGCTGAHNAASATLEDAAAQYRELGATTDLARVEANLAVELLERGSPADALTLLDRARDVLDDASESSLARRCDVYAARALALTGRYQDALARLEHSDASSHGDDLDRLRADIVGAELFADLHLWPEVLAATAELLDRPPLSRLPLDHAAVRTLHARALLQTGEFHDGVLEVSRAIEQLDDLDLPLRAARSRLILAKALSDSDDLISAAYRSFDEAGESWGAASAAILAAEYTSDSIERRRWASLAEDQDAARYPELAWRLETILGELALTYGDSSTADLHFAEAHDVLCDLRRLVTNPSQQLPFMSDRRRPLEARISIALSRGELADAHTLSRSERTWAFASPSSDNVAPGTVLYQAIEGRLSAFVTTANGHTAHVPVAATTADVTSYVDELHRQWGRVADRRMRVHLSPLREASERLLQKMYLELFEPIDQMLEPELTALIIPTGGLSGIPFHLLHDGMTHLFERRSVETAPFDGAMASHPSKSGKTLVVGVPDAIAPAITDEAHRIAEITGGTLLFAEKATAGAVAEAVGEHDVIHLACHGRFRPENPLLSALRLHDRWVGSTELHNWDLHNSFVALAACNSGMQHSSAEDETLGLPRALLGAGARGLVTNLWPVDDLIAVGMMTGFHQRLRQDGPHLALRRVQLAAKHNHSHPSCGDRRSSLVARNRKETRDAPTIST